ncbi:hypothetical protein [Maridesulfovibrio hydrothermalis]|uniref:Uncharacterized protein n=1 Tax=Maridesulfovibrio hydrothermalis AM13 = DSM 14728 TaxID=1121451 RepID=L0RFT9_9BACT|nr:hypothetical protein [Maridesulfovibrio hydrothermalis]CCO25102.1 conserved protein of unknown function [Maridesulfovibrio hydrothermalis AM13 = DSM 14728]
MAVSEVKICNLALRKLGARLIESLSDSSQEAVTCNLFYEQVRDAVLREHPWNFAASRARLAKLVDAPAFGFAFQYQLPVDCLHLRQLSGAEDEFVVEGDKILTSIDSASAVYTVKVTNPVLFDPSFVMAFSARLAAEMADDITGSTTKAREMWTLYLNAMQAARLADSAEGREDSILNDPWLEARGIHGEDSPVWGR